MLPDTKYHTDHIQHPTHCQFCDFNTLRTQMEIQNSQNASSQDEIVHVYICYAFTQHQDCHQHLRSASRHLLVVPRFQLDTYGRRTFAVAGPTTWNLFQNNLREPDMQIDCFVVHWRRVFLISTRHIERIRGASCDNALYKLTFTFTSVYGTSQHSTNLTGCQTETLHTMLVKAKNTVSQHHCITQIQTLWTSQLNMPTTVQAGSLIGIPRETTSWAGGGFWQTAFYSLCQTNSFKAVKANSTI